MALVKCETWPAVLPDDDGIRPAGDPHKCFYCHQEVGEPHAQDCVTVLSITRYAVFADGVRVGTFREEDPFSWTTEDREFHKNEASWCAANALEAIKWDSNALRDQITAKVPDHGCACSLLSFRVEAIEDAGPLRTMPDRRV